MFDCNKGENRDEEILVLVTEKEKNEKKIMWRMLFELQIFWTVLGGRRILTDRCNYGLQSIVALIKAVISRQMTSGMHVRLLTIMI